MTSDDGPCPHCPHPEPGRCPGRRGGRLCGLADPANGDAAGHRAVVAAMPPFDGPYGMLPRLAIEPRRERVEARAVVAASGPVASVAACPHRIPYVPADPGCWCPRFTCAIGKYERAWMKPPNGVYESDCVACLSANQSLA